MYFFFPAHFGKNFVTSHVTLYELVATSVDESHYAWKEKIKDVQNHFRVRVNWRLKYLKQCQEEER